jgi:hypothetical protein
MLSDTAVMGAMAAYAERIRRIERDLLVAEVAQAGRRPSRIRRRMGAALVHVGTRLMTAPQPAATWRVIHVSR